MTANVYNHLTTYVLQNVIISVVFCCKKYLYFCFVNFIMYCTMGLPPHLLSFGSLFDACKFLTFQKIELLIVDEPLIMSKKILILKTHEYKNTLPWKRLNQQYLNKFSMIIVYLFIY